MLNSLQQSIESIQKAKNILILTREDANNDAISGIFALAHSMNKLKKNADIYLLKPVPKKLEFLPKPKNLTAKIKLFKDLIISLNIADNEIRDLKYSKDEKLLKIFITPKNKNVNPEEIKINAGKFKYDLIMTVNSPDLESLGEIFEENPELFFEKPLLNIDNDSGNESYGEINIIEPTKSSVSEIILELIDNFLEENSINEDIATCLLCGISSATKNFRNQNTSPQTFSDAARLINKGARQEEIIRHLYKTKSLSLLNLWGQVMARMNFNQISNIGWSYLLLEDFKKTDSSPSIIPEILEEMSENFPHIESVILFWETNRDTSIILTSQNQLLHAKLNQNFPGVTKNNKSLVKIGHRLNEAKEKVFKILNITNI